MTRLCMRPGCDRDAAARLTYDPIACEVWLDDLAERVGRSQEICSLHAQRLTVPRGWLLSDRRSPQPAMFVSQPEPASEPASEPPRSSRRRRRAAPDHPATQTMELFEVLRQELAQAEAAAAEPAPEPVVEPEPELATDSVEPEPDPQPEVPEPEVPEALRATSPLLARAFASTGHQRSVLTQPGPDTDDPS